MLAIPIGDRFAHFTIDGTAPSQTRQFDVSPTIDNTFYKWGRMIETKDFGRFVLPFTKNLGKAIADSITHDLAIEVGKLRLKNMLDKLTTTRIDTST
jgi:hypothetical protein